MIFLLSLCKLHGISEQFTFSNNLVPRLHTVLFLKKYSIYHQFHAYVDKKDVQFRINSCVYVVRCISRLYKCLRMIAREQTNNCVKNLSSRVQNNENFKLILIYV